MKPCDASTYDRLVSNTELSNQGFAKERGFVDLVHAVRGNTNLDLKKD